MRTDYHKIYAGNEVSAFGGRSSKTVRNFTSYFRQDALPEAVSVTIDWLSFMVEYFGPEGDNDNPVTWINEDLAMEYLKRGATNFTYSFNIYEHGELVAMLHTVPKNNAIMDKNTAKLELKNQLFYSATWLQTLQSILRALKIEYVKNISRLDIAVDGANHVPKFLNAYAFMHTDGKSLVRRGGYIKMLGKARFNPGIKDKRSGHFHHFKIGAGHKQIVVYNKTKELERSHKEYIRDAWGAAGMDKEAEQWRTELRMTSQAIKQIKGGIDLKRLSDPNYLLSLFRTQLKNFFEFIVVEGDTNVTRSRVVDLFQFNKLKVPILEKVQRAVLNGAYKAKMALHMVYMNLCQGKYHHTLRETMLDFIDSTIELYDLNRFFEKKKPDWAVQYLPLTSGT